ncbi:MAG: hypothetical protein NTX64_02065 [Elusimicrobia bacterium]|nr:hypothetical protein [Elusimicrobiota bacterium]
MMKWALVAVTFLAAAPARADGFWFNGGIKGTVGTEEYRGVDASAQLGGDHLSIKPMFSEYSSTATVGTFKTASVRLGYDTDLFGIGVTGGGTPRVNGYSNVFGGVDAILSLTPGSGGPTKRITPGQGTAGGARGEGLTRIDIGASYMHTANRDSFQAANAAQVGVRGPASTVSVAQRANALTIGQNDMTGSVGIKLLGFLFSGAFTKTVYDKDLAANFVRALPVERLNGQGVTTQGMPDTNTALRAELDQLPLITPWASYVHTRYKLGQSNSNALTVGLNVELSILEVVASIEHLAQVGAADRNYMSLGANIRF